MMVAGKTIVEVAADPTPKDPARLDLPFEETTKRKSNPRLLKEATTTPVVAEAVDDADVGHVEEAMITTATRVAITRAVETVAEAAIPEAITTIATVVVAGVAEAMADAVAVAVAARTTPVVEPLRTTSTILSATTRE